MNVRSVIKRKLVNRFCDWHHMVTTSEESRSFISSGEKIVHDERKLMLNTQPSQQISKHNCNQKQHDELKPQNKTSSRQKLKQLKLNLV